jgi:hypothetical protein
MSFDYKKEFVIRGIKIFDIGYITAIYLLLGVILGKYFDKKLFKFNKNNEDAKTTYQIIGELIIYSWIIGVILYVVRNVIPLIPFPLDGIYGFDHMKVKEVTSASAFLVTFVYFLEDYQTKLRSLYTRLKI